VPGATAWNLVALPLAVLAASMIFIIKGGATDPACSTPYRSITPDALAPGPAPGTIRG